MAVRQDKEFRFLFLSPSPTSVSGKNTFLMIVITNGAEKMLIFYIFVIVMRKEEIEKFIVYDLILFNSFFEVFHIFGRIVQTFLYLRLCLIKKRSNSLI